MAHSQKNILPSSIVEAGQLSDGEQVLEVGFIHEIYHKVAVTGTLLDALTILR